MEPSQHPIFVGRTFIPPFPENENSERSLTPSSICLYYLCLVSYPGFPAIFLSILMQALFQWGSRPCQQSLNILPWKSLTLSGLTGFLYCSSLPLRATSGPCWHVEMFHLRNRNLCAVFFLSLPAFLGPLFSIPHLLHEPPPTQL